jgi:hypothetical protein
MIKKGCVSKKTYFFHSTPPFEIVTNTKNIIF